MAAQDLVNDVICEMECLNECPDFPVQNIFAKNQAFLQSDADHQLLIKVKFRQPVKLSGLRFTAVDSGTAPKNVKVFMNKPDLAFAEAEDSVSTQDLDLEEKDVNLDGSGEIVPLKFVKFQNVSSLELLIMENGGDEEISKLRYLEIFGTTGEKSDISEWKPVKG